MFIGVLLFAQFSCVSMCLCACVKCESCRQNGIFNLNGFYRIFAAHTLTCLFSVCNSVMSIEYKVVDLVWKISARYLSIRVNVSFKSYWYIQQKKRQAIILERKKILESLSRKCNFDRNDILETMNILWFGITCDINYYIRFFGWFWVASKLITWFTLGSQIPTEAATEAIHLHISLDKIVSSIIICSLSMNLPPLSRSLFLSHTWSLWNWFSNFHVKRE